MGHWRCLNIIQIKISAFDDFQQQGGEHDLTSALELGGHCRHICEKGGMGIRLFTTLRDKRLSYMVHPASKYKESRQLSRHST